MPVVGLTGPNLEVVPVALLALSELRRARLRSGLLAGAVALLVFLIVFQQGLLDGLINGLIGGLRNGDGDVVVLTEQAQGSIAASFITPEQLAAVESADGVGDVGRVGVAVLNVTSTAGSEEATLVGYDLTRRGGPTTLVDGRLPEVDGEVVVGRAGDGADWQIGGEVQLEADGTVLTVVGVATDAGLNVMPTLYASFETFEAARLAQSPAPSAVLPSFLAVQPEPSVSDAAELAATLTADVAGVEALERHVAADTAPSIDSIRQSFRLIFVLVFVVATLVVSLSFQIATAQKASTLALLRALGRPARELVGALMIQVLLIVGVGGLLGAGAGLALFSAIDIGLDGSGDPVAAAVSTAGVLVLSLLGALAAARRVLRADPQQATGSQGLGI